MADRDTILQEHRIGFLSGFHRLDETTFWGYAVEQSRPLMRFAVEILLDGEPAALVRAEQVDRRLRERGYGDGCYGFVYVARGHHLTSHRVLEARLANSGIAVGQPIDLLRAAFEPAAARRFGSVEWVGGLRLIGKVHNRPDLDSTLRICVFENDVLITEAQPRRWSLDRCPGDAADALHFQIHLPPSFADGKNHDLRVKDEAGHELDGSPLAILAFNDGLREHLRKSTGSSENAARAAWFDRFLPMSLSFESYGQWAQRFPLPIPQREQHFPVRIVLIGSEGADAAARRLTAQSYRRWTAASVPSADCVTFDWSDLADALSASADDASIAIFASTQAVLHPGAIASIAGALQDHEDAVAAYCDLEVTNAAGEAKPVFFGCFDYERMLEQGYAGHCFALRMDKINIPPGEPRGSLARLFLALFDAEDKCQGRILHVPGAFARIAPDAVTLAGQQLQSAVVNHLHKRAVPATVSSKPGSLFTSLHVRRTLTYSGLVSIVIPTRDRVDLLDRCVASIRALTRNATYEIVVIDNDSAAEATHDFLETLQRDGGRVVSVPGPFNFSHLNNRGVEAARGDFICLLNNDTEILDPDWLAELLSRLVERDVGAVAPILVWPNRMVQHGGIVLGLNFAASDAFNDCMEGDAGYGGLLRVAHECSAVTAACMLVRREDYLALSGFDETAFPVLFNDVDFCLRLRDRGKRVVVPPHARLLHHKSATRRKDDTPARAGRFRRELAQLRDRWGRLLADDPSYSPFLNLDPYPFSALAWPPRPARPR